MVVATFRRAVFFLIVLQSMTAAQTSGVSTKRGGICFRVDDDQPLDEWKQYAAVFNTHNDYFSFALNLASLRNQREYINVVRSLQSAGHEMMDHTPDHATQFFTVPLSDTAKYAGLPGVDHIVNNKICLKFDSVDCSIQYSGEGTGHVGGNRTISNKKGGFTLFKNQPDNYFGIYFPSTNRLFSFAQVKGDNASDPDTLELRDFWGEAIDLPDQADIPYEIISVFDIRMDANALNLLFSRSQTDAGAIGVMPPITWVQPGGRTPQISLEDISSGELFKQYYRSAAIYRAPVLKCKNECNSSAVKQYGMQWGDFMEDVSSFAVLKSVIADKVAKHYVLIGHSHFSGLLDGWQGYLARMDSLLSWCTKSNVPVKTQSQWADDLYRPGENNPYENVIPRLDVDLDENGVPDGYSALRGYTDGTLDVTDSPDSSYMNSYAIGHRGSICYIEGLGGLEKGENEFFISTKGGPEDSIEVTFSFPEQSGASFRYKFPATTSQWKRYSVDQSASAFKSLTIPAGVSLCNIRVTCSNYEDSMTVKVGAFVMRKKISDPIKITSLPATQCCHGIEYRYHVDVASKFPNDTLAFGLQAHPAWLSIRPDGTIIGRAPLTIESDSVTVYVTDQHQNSDVQSFVLRVKGRNLMNISARAIDFQQIRLGLKKDTTIYITNAGTDTLTISSVFGWGKRVSVEYDPVVQAGSQSPFKISVTSAVSGKFKEYFVIYSNSPTQPDTVFVTGSVDSINEVDAVSEYPDDFVLFQNFPNPFNAGTDITYALRDKCIVSIVVYNILGQRMKVIESAKFQQPGYYHINWRGDDDNGVSATSGVYFCRMTIIPQDHLPAREFVKKMILMK